MKVKENVCFIISIENFCLTLQEIFPKITIQWMEKQNQQKKFYQFKVQEEIKVRNDVFQKKKITVNIISNSFVDIFDYVFL